MLLPVVVKCLEEKKSLALASRKTNIQALEELVSPFACIISDCSELFSVLPDSGNAENKPRERDPCIILN